jgi:hypothetical protein
LPETHSTHFEETTFCEAICIGDIPGTAIGDEQDPYLTSKIEGIMPDIPRVKSEKSTDIHSDRRKEHRDSDESPCDSSMIVDVPLTMDEFE